MPRSRNVAIRPLDPHGAPAGRLLRLSEELGAALYPPESNHFDDAAELAKPNVRFVGAYVEDEVVGCGAVKIREDDGRYGEIKRLFVADEHRGRGIGTAIMRDLERHLVDAGVSLARLETGVRQPEALALYRRLGYVERPPFGGYRSDPLSVFMEKRLSGESDDTPRSWRAC